MRRKSSFLLLLVLLFGTAIIINVSCKKDKDDEEVCETTNIGGESVKACCTTSNCYYEWNGKKYHCDGVDCNDAAERLVNDILGGGKSSIIDKDELKHEILLLLMDVPED
jgi:hypothetical protein